MPRARTTYPKDRCDEKLKRLVEDWGYDTLEELLTEAASDSVVPGACMNAACDYTTDVEPDQDQGHCEVCESPTVQSCLIIASVI